VLVCHCKVVTDREVQAAVSAGARDEFDVADTCGAGSVCGGCVPLITALLSEGTCAPRCAVSAALQAERRHAELPAG
jgi:bacterioferritin-associated ferredoxin